MEISISYYYHRGEKNRNDLSPSISRHHVISYPRMYYLGVLALCYLKSQPEIVSEKVKLLKDVCGNQNLNIEEALKHVNNCVEGKFSIPSDVPIVQEVLNEIAWMPMNLFTGPSGNFRIDDPSQRNESLPEKMSDEQKGALKKIIGGLKEYSHSFIPHIEGEGGSTKSVHFDNENQFNDLAKLFLENIKSDKPLSCYDSELSDWRIGTKYCKGEDGCYYCGRKINYYEFYFANQNQKTEEILCEKRNNRLLLFGKFALMDPSQNIRTTYEEPGGKKDRKKSGKKSGQKGRKKSGQKGRKKSGQEDEEKGGDGPVVCRVLAKEKGYLICDIVNRESEQFRNWRMPIKDFLK